MSVKQTAPNSRTATQDPTTPLTAANAVTLIQPIYDALTASSAETIRPLLESATTPDWENCGSTGGFDSREATIARWTARLSRIPDLGHASAEILVSGNRVIVRGEVTGTPAGAFMGIDPTGRSFKVLTIDIHEIEGGLVRRTFHVEDWVGAMRQLGTAI